MPWGRYKQKIKRIRELHAEWSGAKDLTRGGSHIACVFVVRPSGWTALLCSSLAWPGLVWLGF